MSKNNFRSVKLIVKKQCFIVNSLLRCDNMDTNPNDKTLGDFFSKDEQMDGQTQA